MDEEGAICDRCGNRIGPNGCCATIEMLRREKKVIEDISTASAKARSGESFDTFRVFQRTAHRIAKDHGWWDPVDVDLREPTVRANGEGNRNIGELLALVHSEVSEALEEYRNGTLLTEYRLSEKGKPEGFSVELADIVIRVFDLCEHLGIDLCAVVAAKMIYNESRP